MTLTAFPAPTFRHLSTLTDKGGMYEHALGSVARTEHGYCVDDVARGLVVLCRESHHDHAMSDPTLAALRSKYLAFVLAAEDGDGRFRNRRDSELSWTDEPSLEDCWGRALWGLGFAASSGGAAPRWSAMAAFERGARHRSPWSRAMCFAAIGAAEVLLTYPDNAAAKALMHSAVDLIDLDGTSQPWPWPESRLTYGNAVVPEVLIAGAVVLSSRELLAEGLKLLEWLCAEQTLDGHLSVVPVGGRGPGDVKPGFDQQPIEVAALADACARAFAATQDPHWLHYVELAAGWFLGNNDSEAVLYDPVTGGGCDGLERDGRNDNQGAESTLAMISTFQHARLMTVASN